MTDTLTVEGLSKHFGGLIAVDRVDFHIRSDVTTGIIGPNGSGKTTFFNLLSGFFPPTSGRVVFLGDDVTHAPAHKRVLKGMVRTFQLVSVFNSMTVWENLVLSAVRFEKGHASPWRFLSSPAETVRSRCMEALGTVGLQGKAYSPTSELSYGFKRILEIAIALSLKPRLLLLDEPLAGLSDVEITEVLEILRRIKKNLALVIIEHKLSHIVDLVDRLCVMNEGSFICEGEPERVLSDSTVRECYWGKSK
jgi:branched-chain amino acid transport system ATP-binding protein